MSRAPSSTDPFHPPELNEKQMLTSVEEYCAADAPPAPFRSMIEFFRDPFSRTDGYRPSPVWITLSILLIAGLSTFLYFSLWSH